MTDNPDVAQQIGELAAQAGSLREDIYSLAATLERDPDRDSVQDLLIQAWAKADAAVVKLYWARERLERQAVQLDNESRR